MSATRFLTDNPLTRKRWANDLFRILLPAVEYDKLVGTSPDSIVQIKTELGKGEGDQITFGIRLPLTGDPIVGDGEVEGNEEKLQFRDFKSTIEEVNKAVDTGGKMEEQRIPYNLMQEGKSGLQDWWAEFLSKLIINHLVGNSAYRVAGKTLGQDPTEPDSNHHLIMNAAANEAALTNTDLIDLSFLDKMKQRAELANLTGGFKVRPLRINGKDMYRVIMHNYMFDALRQNVNVGQWGDLTRAANKLQMPEVEIEYNGMLIMKSERVPRIVGTDADGSGVYRCVLLGCQAAVWAWGGAGETKGSVMSFVPYKRDAERFLMVRGGGILGVKKTVFNSQDFGVVTGSGWAKPLA